MTDLLDVNVLVSLAWPNHVHHLAARAWFARDRAGAWATTPITECGFVRVSSNRSAIPTAVTPAEAVLLLSQMRALEGHVFLVDDLQAVVGEPPEPPRLATHSLVTDAHLLALARRHDARLVTFDRGVAAMAGHAPVEDVLLLQPKR